MLITIRLVMSWIDRPDHEAENPLAVGQVYTKRAAEFLKEHEMPDGTPLVVGGQIVFAPPDVLAIDVDGPFYADLLVATITNVVWQFPDGPAEVVAHVMDGAPAPSPETAQSVEAVLIPKGFIRVPPDEMRVEPHINTEWVAPHD